MGASGIVFRIAHLHLVNKIRIEYSSVPNVCMTINLLLLPHPQRQSLLQQLERNEREMAATAMELDLYLQGRRRNRMRSPFALPLPRFLISAKAHSAWVGKTRRFLDGLLPFVLLVLGCNIAPALITR